jgi:hypothetical protein
MATADSIQLVIEKEHLLESLAADWDEDASESDIQSLRQLFELSFQVSPATEAPLTLLLRTAADMARHEPNRGRLSGDAICRTIVSVCQQALHANLAGLSLQCVRCFGNLCYEQTQNRLTFSDLGVYGLLETIVAAPDMMRLVAAVVANLLSEEDRAMSEIFKHPRLLNALVTAFIANADLDTLNRAIGNLVVPVNTPALIEAGVFERLLEIIPRAPSAARTQTINLLTELFESDEKEFLPALSEFLIFRSNFINLVLGILEHPLAEETAQEAVELREQAQLPYFATRPPLTRQKLGMILAALASSNETATPFLPTLERLLHLVTQTHDIIARRCAAHVLGCLTIHSPTVASFNRQHAPAFLDTMVSQVLPDGDCEIQVGVMLVLGNFIQQVEDSQALMALGAHELLTQFLDQQYDPRVVHLTLGTLLKLSLPAEHKPLIASPAFVKGVEGVLNHSRDVTILYAAVSCLRSLLSLHDTELQGRILDAAPIVETFIGLWDRIWQSGTERVLWEVSRIMAHLIIDGWFQRLQAAGAVEKPLATLISSPHALLRTEGWKAIHTILAQGSSSSAAAAQAPLVAILNNINRETTTALDASHLPDPSLPPVLCAALQDPTCEFHPQSLSLANNPLADHVAALESLVNHSPYLEKLDLTGTHLDETTLLTLRSTNPQMQIL